MASAIRCESLGSLLRSPWLSEARRALRRGEIAAVEYKRIEDRAVDDAIVLQQKAGIDVITDGEQRRPSFLGALIETVDGLVRSMAVKMPWRADDQSVEPLSLGLVVKEKIRPRRSLALEEFAYARARATAPIKMTLPSPLMLSFFYSPDESGDAYRDPFDLFADGAAIMRAEIAELKRIGCERIQIDAPELAMAADAAASAAIFDAVGISSARLINEGAGILNSLADVSGVAFELHLCRGNNDGRWLARGGYETLAREALGHMNRFSVLMLEYDDQRSGPLEALSEMPRDKQVILGLVSTKHAALEAEEALITRINDAARYFPLDQLGVSTQCGFASGVRGNPLDSATQEKKLRLVGSLARRIWR